MQVRKKSMRETKTEEGERERERDPGSWKRGKERIQIKI